MATNSQFLFSIIVFYGILFVALSFYGSTLYDLEAGNEQVRADLEAQKDGAGLSETIWINIGLFILNVFSPLMPIYAGISSLPFWFNAILFTPILIITIWIIVVTIIPGVSDA